ncbi:DUF885 domain-containing protein [Neolewinella antarctica]|uniref:Uncharacterized protein (DUF885 family) n=1 Tax=Neolewinella antarctica TaxID=442734 RepID=A0ABX0XDC7_9BACT|nr:DUF885 domain-containing protein [Neolewinella antarctica]NJC27308.1 uncharacterized protein (DUF885 family) [Neolewinella antarctica]
MRFFPLFVLYLFLTACANEEPASTQNLPPLEDLLKNYNEERLQLYPFEATFQGDNRYNDQMPNALSQVHRNTLDAFYNKTADALAKYDREQLSSTDKVSYDVLKWETDINLEALTFREELLPLDQFSGFHLMAGQLASGQSAQPFVTVEDYDNWLKRTDALLEMLDTAIVNMKMGVEEGYVLPASLIAKLQPQLDAMTAEPLQNHLFYGPARNLPDDITGTDRDRILSDYETMVEKVMRKFQEVATYVENEYAGSGRTSSGIDAIPDGAAYYAHLIKLYTTTDMGADEIHQLGLSEVARLSSEMEKVKADVGFTGGLQEFFDHVRARKELMPFNQPEEVIVNFEAIHERMKPQLELLFDQTPKTPFEVRRTEAFREASASAEYNPGSQDGTRPGVFYVPIPDVRTYNIFSDEDLFLHEAIPGHHYQISLTQENEDLPDFRRSLWYSAYGEGWALYSESLGKELGLYEDPYQYFGMLSAEMHRAIRLVVDTGIHSKGWSREEAIQYSLENEAESEASITAEIERYMAIPAQALSYKIGQLKILELRAMAENKLGEEFDIKAFHNLVLSPGCVPLAVLETMVGDWVTSEAN